MAPPTKKPAVEEDVDETLAANFKALMAGRSVGALRLEMAERGMAIGSGAIQAAKIGSRGLRLETLQKFADFFGCQLYELLTPGEEIATTWPFTKLDPKEFARASAEIKEEAEAMLIRSAKRASLGELPPTPGIDNREAA